MIEVDWSTLFKSFYEIVRVKVACKDFRKIPPERLYEMNRKLHVVSFLVEADLEKVQGGQDNDGDGGDDDGQDDDGKEDDLLDDDAIDEQPQITDPSSSNSSGMKTPAARPSNNAGHKTISMGESWVAHLDQEK